MEKRLYKKTNGQMICGVCNGVADYLNADVSLVRLAAVIAACVSFGTVALIYLAAAVILPEFNG
ncbi:MAG: PspC domain-containing protein [Ruminococcus sp.]|nr:PspC domain-containing protein [Ruminococcus sp.]